MEKTIEIPFGAKDSELKGWEYTIPENMEAEIKDGKVIVREKESEDEKIRKWLIEMVEELRKANPTNAEHNGNCSEALAYLEKQKEQKFIDYPHVPGWRKNRDGNKPKLKHSVLMLTTHGVAEGEWLGEKWCQYRWSCELKDNEILYWIHLSDLTQLEKEDEIIEKEQKPAEWSDTEKMHLANAILAAEKEWGVNSYTARFLESLRDNYKKCNSRWKPSEEQMKEYSYWYKNFIESGLASPSSKAVTILGELLEQLKKL